MWYSHRDLSNTQDVGRPGLSSVWIYFDSLFTLYSSVKVEPMTSDPIRFHVFVGSSGIFAQITLSCYLCQKYCRQLIFILVNVINAALLWISLLFKQVNCVRSCKTLKVRPHKKWAAAGNRGGLRSGDARQGTAAKSGPMWRKAI
jgi:hypothetical protein